MNIEEYFRDQVLNTYRKSSCSNSQCKKEQKNDIKNIFKYCFECKKDYCIDCFLIHDENHKDKCIDIPAKAERCLEHVNEDKFETFCKDCHVNVCKKENHNEHKTIKLASVNLQNAEEIIKNKNRILQNIIKFNETILETYKNYPNNYFHSTNVINLAESIKKENERDTEILNGLFEGMKNKLLIQNKAIEDLKTKNNIFITGKEEKLNLVNKNIDNESLFLLSKIQFVNLKKLDLRGNKIEKIDDLQNMQCFNLKTLDLGENKIKDISPLKQISDNMREIEELNLNGNEIVNVEVLGEDIFPQLKSMRLDNNKIDYDSEKFKEALKKFGNKIQYKVLNMNKFNLDYEVEPRITKESKNIKLYRCELGNFGVKELYLINGVYNQLKKLNLSDNKISQLTYLKKISFANLEHLDLSFNNIVEVDEMNEMDLNQLKFLFLNSNEISNISPLLKMAKEGKGNLDTLDIEGNKYNARHNQLLIAEIKKLVNHVNY